MEGNNTQSKEGFIKGLTHPRKVELVKMVMADTPDIEAMFQAGFSRITILEMARDVKRNVEGMDALNIEIPRDYEAEKSTKESAVETVNGDNTPEAPVATETETPVAPATNEGQVVDPNAAPVATQDAPTGGVQNVANPTPEAPVAPEAQVPNTPETPVAPVAPETNERPQG